MLKAQFPEPSPAVQTPYCILTRLPSDSCSLRLGFLPQRACPKLQDRRSAKVLSAPITGAGSQPRENTRRKGAQLPPVEGAVSLQTTSQRQLDPSPTGRNFRRFSQGPKPHTWVCKNVARCLITIFFLSGNFTGCQCLAFLLLALASTLSISLSSPLTRRQQRQKGQSQNQSSRGPRNPSMAQPRLFSTRKQPGEVKGCVHGVESKVLGAELCRWLFW